MPGGSPPTRFAAALAAGGLGLLAAVAQQPAPKAPKAGKADKAPAAPRPPLSAEERAAHLPPVPPSPRLAADGLVFQTVDGTAVIEAEHFTGQRRDQIRRWYVSGGKYAPTAKPDPDPVNVADAGAGGYVEVLPDTFVIPKVDRPIDGLNLGNMPGSMAVLVYNVHFAAPGRYYLWTRVRSNDEEDNTLHAGLDDTWPDSAKVLQFPKLKKEWWWENGVRANVPGGEGKLAYLDVPTAGVHAVMYSMREDGMEFDRFILTTKKDFPKPTGVGPPATPPKAGKLPAPLTAEGGAKPTSQAAPAADKVFAAVTGMIEVEAEDFFKQTSDGVRKWYVTSADRTPDVKPDIDGPHLAGASGGAYVEVLPDTGVNGGKLKAGESISDKPGEMAVLHYRVRFDRPGKYYIWARAFGTDGDDNTLHFGLDDTWPDSSARMHTFAGKEWKWACRHRQHKGKIWFEVPTAGDHVVTLSMREDGCELDKFVLTRDENYAPQADPVVFAERGGVVAIEVESAPAADGWARKAGDGATGSGYLEWAKPGQGRKPGEGVLGYEFRITTPGNYQFLWRNRLPDPANRPDTLDPDGNDSWVRFVGGTDVPGQATFGNAWKKVAILGHPSGWTWNTQADGGPPHPLTPVCRAYQPGVYRVEVCGRSLGHALDRIVLRRYEGEPVKQCSPADEAELTALPAER